LFTVTDALHFSKLMQPTYPPEDVETPVIEKPYVWDRRCYIVATRSLAVAETADHTFRLPRSACWAWLFQTWKFCSWGVWKLRVGAEGVKLCS